MDLGSSYQMQFRPTSGCDWVDVDDADVDRDIRDQCLSALEDEDVASEVVLAPVGQYRALLVY